MKLVWAPALFADSGEATPSMTPVPKRSGCRDTFFSRAYAANGGSAAPPPGGSPAWSPRTFPSPWRGRRP